MLKWKHVQKNKKSNKKPNKEPNTSACFSFSISETRTAKGSTPKNQNEEQKTSKISLHSQFHSFASTPDF